MWDERSSTHSRICHYPLGDAQLQRMGLILEDAFKRNMDRNQTEILCSLVIQNIDPGEKLEGLTEKRWSHGAAQDGQTLGCREPAMESSTC